MPSICLVAGDPSGDAHAAMLIAALQARRTDWTFSGLGGPAMQRAGVTLLDDLTQASAIGPVDAARHLGRFTRAKRLLDAHLTTSRPDLVLLVDFGDFNLPVIAPLAKRHRLPVLYYISPQLWAWGRWRMRYVRRHVDRMLVFFPFEADLYRRAGVPVTWVGHPLVEEARPSCSRSDALAKYGLNPWRRTVGLLPGSRAHEIRRHLPLMLEAGERIAQHMPGVQFLLPRSAAVPRETIDAHLAQCPLEVRIAEGSVYDALQLMDGAMVASGTATLDAALCGVPMVVLYRGSWVTYLFVRSVIRVPHIALVNILAGRAVVPELLQHRARPARVAAELMTLLRDEERAESVKAGLQEVTAKLGEPGAVSRAADAVLDFFKK